MPRCDAVQEVTVEMAGDDTLTVDQHEVGGAGFLGVTARTEENLVGLYFGFGLE